MFRHLAEYVHLRIPFTLTIPEPNTFMTLINYARRETQMHMFYQTTTTWRYVQCENIEES